LRTTGLLVPKAEGSVPLFSLDDGPRSISLKSVLSTAESDGFRRTSGRVERAAE
jgi:hypothetical protein